MPDARAGAQALLARAIEDEEAARALLDIDRVADSVVGFHAQQAVEKALKAVLVLKGVRYRYTHDVAYLVELCEGVGAALPDELREVDRLSVFAVRLRYDLSPATPVKRSQAMAWASGVVGWARELIERE